MPIYFYHSTLIGDIASESRSIIRPSSNSGIDHGSCNGASPTTSSQIFLSRGVAGPDEPASTPPSTIRATVASIFESNSSHVMTLGDAAAKTVSSQQCSGEETSREALDNLYETDTRVSATSKKSFHCSNSTNSKLLPVFLTKDQIRDIPSPMLTLSPDDLSECSDETSLDHLSSSPPNGKGKGIDTARGRTPEREHRFSNPLERAESRIRRKEPAIEIDARSIGKRGIRRSSTFFENPNDLEAVLEDQILEPCPHIPICSKVSEVVDASSRGIMYAGTPIHLRGTGTSLDNFQSIASPRSQPISASIISSGFPATSPVFSLQPEPASRAYHNVSNHESLVTEAYSPPCARSDHGIITHHNAYVKLDSMASDLPAEILQQVFLYLSPTDFNSARHTCRSWFIHSLRKSLLELFLRRMGFSDAICNSISAGQTIRDNSKAKYEWLLSKRIARECALGPNWSGNGLLENATSVPAITSAFTQAAVVDFTEVSVHYPGPDFAGTLFTVSSCGRFLMAANGCLVYIYELNRSHEAEERPEGRKIPGRLRPVTSIICPLRVLACSMDTSSYRYAIAILLDGRVGVVCDITTLGPNPSLPETLDRDGSKAKDHQWESTHSCGKTVLLDRTSLDHTKTSEKGRPCHESTSVLPHLTNTAPQFPAVNRSAWQDVFRDGTHDSTSSLAKDTRHVYIPLVRTLGFDETKDSDDDAKNSLPMPLEDGPRSIYRNLCSEDDPPRSVAICPQRRCVAFGCSSGIELHWVDALTGQNLNRWFPLTAPSDYLFFLPPRKSVDSAKKLRLISSASRPNDRPAIAERQVGVRTHGSPYWAGIGRKLSHTDRVGSQKVLPRFGGDTGRRYTSGRIDASDHYRAIPLSDGHHLLFTDPDTGLLCLGSDAPIGGPTKLLRKIWFQGPEGEGAPVAYSGGSDLSTGIRIVAAFGHGEQQSIWLYSVPGDIFSISQGETPVLVGSMSKPNTSKNDLNTDWMAWWPDDDHQEWLKHAQGLAPGDFSRSVWPVKMKGQLIGTCNGLADLTINSGAHMAIWAFGKDGLATAWKINNGSGEKTRKYCVARDGTVKETAGTEEKGSSLFSLPEAYPISPDSFDGTASFRTRSYRRKRRRISSYQGSFSIQLDADGDVVMTDVDDAEEDVWRYIVEEDLLDDMTVDAKLYSHKMAGGDMAGVFKRNLCIRDEQLTGITRLDLEIR